MYDTTTDNWPKEDILRIKSQIALLSFGASVEDKSFKTFMAGKGNLTVQKFLGIK